jgi:hypothetical protein
MLKHTIKFCDSRHFFCSVADLDANPDPDPLDSDPPDLRVFGPPGSGSGSGSFYH